MQRLFYGPLILGMIILGACSGAGRARPIPVTLVVETPPPSPTPAQCTELPRDMEFSVKKAGNTAVSIRLSGLHADEKPIVILETGSEGHFRRIEELATSPIGDSGVFETVVEGVRPLEDAERSIWKVKVIHARGVACATIAVP